MSPIPDRNSTPNPVAADDQQPSASSSDFSLSLSAIAFSTSTPSPVSPAVAPIDFHALSVEASITHQMDLYLRMQLLNDEGEPIEPDDITAWAPVAEFYLKQEREGRMPLICKLAQKYLAAPISSVYSERLFSEMGQIYEKKRSRLRPTTAEGLLFLHHNMVRCESYDQEEEDARKAERRREKINFAKYDAPVEIVDRHLREQNDDIYQDEADIVGIYDPEDLII